MHINLPNQITIFRMVLIPFIIAFLIPYQFTNAGFYISSEYLLEVPNGYIIASYVMALILFIIATISDGLDGYYARKYNLSSPFGKIFDPLADKVLTLSLFIIFCFFHFINPYIVLIILGRELLISGLRTFAAFHNQAMAANRWGKHKTGWQIALIICMFLQTIFQESVRMTNWNPSFIKWTGHFFSFSYYLITVTTIFLTLYSCWLYFTQNWQLLNKLDEGSPS